MTLDRGSTSSTERRQLSVTVSDAIREISKLKQADLAKVLGITPQSAGALLRRSDSMKVSTLLNILDTFDATLSITTAEGQVLQLTKG